MKQQASGASLLAIERDQLARGQAHLERSNKELLQALKSAYDADYKEAVQDNIVTIAKYRARIAALDEEIQRLEGGEAHVFEPEQVPVEGATTGTSQQQQQMQQQRQQEDVQRQQGQASAGPMDLTPDDVGAQQRHDGGGSAPMDADQELTTAQQQQQDAAAPSASSLDVRGGSHSVDTKTGAAAAVRTQADDGDDQAAADQGLWM